MYENRNGTDIYYYYDSYGTPTAIRYYETVENSDGSSEIVSYMFYLATNQQGDIIGIYNASGNMVVKYEYDAWGNIIAETNATGGTPTSLAQKWSDINPFRYRSYYYDSETGLYYLNSRYYDSETGRFLNADDCIILIEDYETILQYNLFAYCLNNPINMIDPDGYSSIALSSGRFIAAMVTSGLSNSWNPVGLVIVGVAVGLFVAKIVIDYVENTSSSKSDPYARPGQKKQGRERKNKARRSKDWKPRSKPKPPKKHTPSKDHQKVKRK